MTLSSNASVIEPPSPSENVSVPPWNAPPPWGGRSTMAGSPLSPAPPPEPTTWSTTRSANGSAPASPTDPMTATAHSTRRFMVPPPPLPGRWTRVHAPATLAAGLAQPSSSPAEGMSAGSRRAGLLARGSSSPGPFPPRGSGRDRARLPSQVRGSEGFAPSSLARLGRRLHTVDVVGCQFPPHGIAVGPHRIRPRSPDRLVQRTSESTALALDPVTAWPNPAPRSNGLPLVV